MARCRQTPSRGGETGEGARAVGGIAAAPATDYVYAFAAAVSSAAAVFVTFPSCRKSFRIFHSPWPVVAPNAAGVWSDMSNRNVSAPERDCAAWRWTGSG